MNLVFVLFAHVQTLVKWCSLFLSASHVFTISGSFRSHIFETWFNACIRERIVSSARPSRIWYSLKLKISVCIWAGVVIFWAGVVIPA